jgi:uncharacterized protein (UPF0216 family)
MTKLNLTAEQAEKMYYNIHLYFLLIRCAEMVDQSMFKRLKFSNPTMNNHLRKARQSLGQLMMEFNKAFRAKDEDIVHYDAPSELFEAMEYLSRLTPDQIRERVAVMIEYGNK